MIVTANLNSLRIAPRKVRLLSRFMKGKDALAIKHQLRYWTKRSAKPLEKLLDSAIANARNNHNLVADNLRVQDVIVDGGTVLKRFKPKGFGSASPIAKRTSHVKIILEEKVLGLRNEAQIEAKPEHAHEHERTVEAKPAVKQTIGHKTKDGIFKSISRKLFRQKKV